MEMFDILILYKAIELILVFWLLALLFKWVLYFIFGTKGAKIIGFIGYTLNFSIKKFVLTRIFRLEVHECEPFKLTFTHEETDRWDILFTSLVVFPMFLGLVVGTLVGTLGLLLESQLAFISIILYIIGFIISVNSIPTFQDVKELKNCSVRSIVIWFKIATLLCGILCVILVPLLNTLGVIIAVIIGILSTSFMTFFIPPLSEKMVCNKSTSIIGGTVDLDG